MLSNESKIVRNNSITAVSMGDELSMLDVETGKYFVLNSIGSDIWNKLENPCVVSELINAIKDEYEVDEARCIESVNKYLNDMLTKKLIIIEG